MKASETVVEAAHSSVTSKKVAKNMGIDRRERARQAVVLRRVVGGLVSVRKTNAKQSKVKLNNVNFALSHLPRLMVRSRPALWQWLWHEGEYSKQ